MIIIQGLVKSMLLSGGYIFLGFGILGIFLPMLPTTPLLLLSAACFSRSSDRIYNKLVYNKWLGSYIRNYREGKGIPLRAKVMAIFFLWLTLGYSVYFLIPYIVVKVGVILIALAVSIHILSQKTKRATQ